MGLQLLSAGQYVTIPTYDPSGLSQISVCGWITATNNLFGYYGKIFWRGPSTVTAPYHQVALAVQSTNQWQFILHINGSVYIASFTDTTWYDGKPHHICGTYDGSYLKIYLDGVYKAQTAATGNISNYTTWINRIGSYTYGVGEYMNGNIWDVRIYNRGISADECLTIYSAKGADNIANGLVARWIMDEDTDGNTASGSGTILDISGNDFNGTPNNSPTYRAVPVKLFDRRK